MAASHRKKIILFSLVFSFSDFCQYGHLINNHSLFEKSMARFPRYSFGVDEFVVSVILDDINIVLVSMHFMTQNFANTI